MITDRQKELLETEAVAMASINSDGSPNVIAVGFTKVVGSDLILITDNYMKITKGNIVTEPRVCLAVWTKDWEEGYKFIGKAEYFGEGKWFDFVKNMEENRGSPAKGAILVRVKNINKLA